MLTTAEYIPDDEIYYASTEELYQWLCEEAELADCSKIHRDNHNRIEKELKRRNKNNRR